MKNKITLFKLIRMDSDGRIDLLDVFKNKNNAERKKKEFSDENLNFKYDVIPYECDERNIIYYFEKLSTLEV